MKRRGKRYDAFHPMIRRIDQAADAMTTSGQEPRKHHLVPRFYLERWAVEGRVRVTDLSRGTSYAPSPKQAARQTDFYRLEPGAFRGSPVWWEVFLSQLEGEASEALRVLDNSQIDALTLEKLGEFYWFVAMQFTRGVAFRENLQWTALQGHVIGYQSSGDEYIKKRLADRGRSADTETVAQARDLLLAMIADPLRVPMPNVVKVRESADMAAKLIPYLLQRRAVLYNTPRRLITCDEPLAAIAEEMGADVGDFGIANAPILVFPLSPTRVLALFHPDLPIRLAPDAELTVRETVELNQVLAGNASRLTFEIPTTSYGVKLYVPPRPAGGDRQVVQRRPNGEELHRLIPARRWRRDPAAPTRPVRRWWE